MQMEHLVTNSLRKLVQQRLFLFLGHFWVALRVPASPLLLGLHPEPQLQPWGLCRPAPLPQGLVTDQFSAAAVTAPPRDLPEGQQLLLSQPAGLSEPNARPLRTSSLVGDVSIASPGTQAHADMVPLLPPLPRGPPGRSVGWDPDRVEGTPSLEGIACAWQGPR